MRFIVGIYLLGSLLLGSEMVVFSPDMKRTIPLKHVFKGFGCEGDNISPALTWSGIPKETKSLAITIYDPDAPTGSGWWHWMVYNMPSHLRRIEQGASQSPKTKFPKGTKQHRIDYGVAAYGGPCPPKGHGEHRYIITLHALDVESIDIPETSSSALLGYMLNTHSIKTAKKIYYYQR